MTTFTVQVGRSPKMAGSSCHRRRLAGLTWIMRSMAHHNGAALREQHVVDFHDGVMVVEDPERLAELASAPAQSAPAGSLRYRGSALTTALAADRLLIFRYNMVGGEGFEPPTFSV
jgi:hypothetical protein